MKTTARLMVERTKELRKTETYLKKEKSIKTITMIPFSVDGESVVIQSIEEVHGFGKLCWGGVYIGTGKGIYIGSEMVWKTVATVRINHELHSIGERTPKFTVILYRDHCLMQWKQTHTHTNSTDGFLGFIGIAGADGS